MLEVLLKHFIPDPIIWFDSLFLTIKLWTLIRKVWIMSKINGLWDNGKLCNWFDKLEFSFFFFPIKEKLYPSRIHVFFNACSVNWQYLRDIMHAFLEQ